VILLKGVTLREKVAKCPLPNIFLYLRIILVNKVKRGK